MTIEQIQQAILKACDRLQGSSKRGQNATNFAKQIKEELMKL
jgi:hypothetical protein